MPRAGAVWVSVLPDMSKFASSMRVGLSMPLGGLGRDAGRSFGGAFSAEAGRSAEAVGRSVQVAADKQAAAAGRLQLAADKQASAVGRLRVAQLQLTEVQGKGKASAVQLAAAEERVAVATRGLGAAEERVAGATRAQAAAARGLTVAQGEVAASAEVAGSRATGFGSRVEGAGRRASRSIGGLGKEVLGLGGLFAGFAAVGFLSKSIKDAGDFQKQMMLLVTAGGEASSNLGLVSNGIKALAVSTGTSTTDLASGMYVMEKAGLRGANGLTVLKAAAQGAKDENANLGVVTNALTSVMRSYNLPAAQANSVMNQMVVAAGESKTSMENFAGSLSTVMPLASSAGISFAQVGGAIATLTSHGTSADQATQDLAFTIRSLQAPNNVATLAMAQLGLNSQDVASRLGKRGLTGTIEMLSATVLHQMGPSGQVLLRTFNNSTVAALDAQQMFQRLPPAAQAAARGFLSGDLTLKAFRHTVMGMPAPVASLAAQWAATENKSKGFNQQLRSGNQASLTYTATMKKVMGGAAGLQTALMLTGGSAGFFNHAVGAIGASAKTTGSDITAWKMAQETFNVQLDRFKQSVNVAGITLGTALLPPLTRFAAWLANNVPRVVAFSQAHSGMIKPLLVVTGAIIGLTVASAALNAVMAINPYVLIAAGVVALGIGLVMLYRHSETFRSVVGAAMHGGAVAVGWVVTAFHAVVSAGGVAARWVQGAWGSAVGVVSSATRTAVAGATRAWSGLVGGAQSAWRGVTGAVGGAARGIRSAMQSVGAAAGWLWHSVFEPVAQGIGGAVMWLWRTQINPTVRLIAGITSWLGNAFYQSAILIKDVAIYLVASSVLWLWNTVINPTFRLVAGLAGWLYRYGIKPQFDAISTVIGAVGTAAHDTWNDLIQPAWKAISGGAETMWSQHIQPMFSAIGGAFGAVGTAAHVMWASYLQPAFSAVESASKGLWTAYVSPFFNNIRTMIGTTIPNVFYSGVKAVTTHLQSWGTAVSNLWAKYVSPIGDSIQKWIVTDVPSYFATGVAAIGKAWSGLSDIAKVPIKFLVNTVLNGGLIWAFNKIAGAVHSSAHINPIQLPKGFASGGWIKGPGTGTSDSILGRFSHGEFVVNARSAEKHAGLLERINGGPGAGPSRAGAMPAFSVGGWVDSAWKKVTSGASGLIGALSDPAKLLEKLVPLGELKQFGGSGMGQLVGDTARSAFGVVKDSLVGILGSLLGGGGGGIADGPAIVAAARKFIGVPYLWGGTEPNGFDCSGLVQYILGKFNVHAPRTAAQQEAWATPEPARAAGIGDLVFFDQPTGHVGINEGNGRMIDAPHTGAFIREENIWPGARYGRIPGMAARPGAPGGGGPGGGGAGMPTGDMVTRWAPLVTQTLGELGLSQSGGMIARVLRQIKTESGGDPNATQGNIGDVNNRTGDLGRGLMQVIRATFDAYAGPTRPFGQYNPHASIYAGLNYDSHKFGGNPNLSDLGQGHGYDNGGYLPPGTTLVHNDSNVPEPVFSGRQWDILKRNGADGSGSGGGDTHIHVVPQHSNVSMDDLLALRDREAVLNRSGRRS